MPDGSTSASTPPDAMRLAALPAHIQSYIALLCERHSSLAGPLHLDSLIRSACAALGASVRDFPHLTPTRRRELEIELNLAALKDHQRAKCRVVCGLALRRRIRRATRTAISPGAHRRDAWRSVKAALSDHRPKLCGTVQNGAFYAGHDLITYRIEYVPAAGPGAPTIPWNNDLGRRKVILNLHPLSEPAFDRTGS